MQMPERKKCRCIKELGEAAGNASSMNGNIEDARNGVTYLLTRDATLFDLVEQGFVADAQLLGGAAAVPVHRVEGFFDQRALGLDRRRFRHVGEPRSRRRRRGGVVRDKKLVVSFRLVGRLA